MERVTIEGGTTSTPSLPPSGGPVYSRVAWRGAVVWLLGGMCAVSLVLYASPVCCVGLLLALYSFNLHCISLSFTSYSALSCVYIYLLPYFASLLLLIYHTSHQDGVIYHIPCQYELINHIPCKVRLFITFFVKMGLFITFPVKIYLFITFSVKMRLFISFFVKVGLFITFPLETYLSHSLSRCAYLSHSPSRWDYLSHCRTLSVVHDLCLSLLSAAR